METNDANPFLPSEIITCILVRLPVKSLIRFQCVCKEWKILFKTQSFIKEHLHHSSHQNPYLCFEDIPSTEPIHVRLLNRDMQVLDLQNGPWIAPVPHVHPISIYYPNYNVHLLTLQLHDYYCFLSSTLNIWTISSCNGLIFLGSSNIHGGVSLSLWNPATRQVRHVSHDGWKEHNFVGFGFSPIVNDYKIVKIHNSSGHDVVTKVEVYSLNLGTWKEKVVDGTLNEVAILCDGFAFNGAIFWVESKLVVHDQDEHYIGIIVSFDVATEVFTLISSPVPFPFLNGLYYKFKHLAVYENKLTMLSHTLSEDLESSFIHVWVMEEEEGTSGSKNKRWNWTKIYSSSPYRGGVLVPWTIWTNEIVCNNVQKLPGHHEQIEDVDGGGPDHERKIVMFNLTTKEFKTLDIREFPFGFGIFNYEESLVPV